MRLPPFGRRRHRYQNHLEGFKQQRVLQWGCEFALMNLTPKLDT